MGVNDSILLNNQEFIDLTNWKIYQRVKNNLAIWRHVSKDEQMIQRSFNVITQKQFKKIYQCYKFRFGNQYMVKTIGWNLQQSKQYCGANFKGSIFYERLLTSLSKIKDIPFIDSLHFYSVSLKGFQLLFQKFGYFQVFEEMFHISQNARVKIWFDKDISKYQPDSYLRDQLCKQQDMVTKIINIIDQNTDSSEESKRFKRYMINKMSNFSLAQLTLRQFCKQNNLSPPQRLNFLYTIQNSRFYGFLDQYSQIVRQPSLTHLNSQNNKVISNHLIQNNQVIPTNKIPTINHSNVNRQSFKNPNQMIIYTTPKSVQNYPQRQNNSLSKQQIFIPNIPINAQKPPLRTHSIDKKVQFGNTMHKTTPIFQSYNKIIYPINQNNFLSPNTNLNKLSKKSIQISNIQTPTFKQVIHHNLYPYAKLVSSRQNQIQLSSHNSNYYNQKKPPTDKSSQKSSRKINHQQSQTNSQLNIKQINQNQKNSEQKNKEQKNKEQNNREQKNISTRATPIIKNNTYQIALIKEEQYSPNETTKNENNTKSIETQSIWIKYLKQKQQYENKRKKQLQNIYVQDNRNNRQSIFKQIQNQANNSNNLIDLIKKQRNVNILQNQNTSQSIQNQSQNDIKLKNQNKSMKLNMAGLQQTYDYVKESGRGNQFKEYDYTYSKDIKNCEQPNYPSIINKLESQIPSQNYQNNQIDIYSGMIKNKDKTLINQISQNYQFHSFTTLIEQPYSTSQNGSFRQIEANSPVKNYLNANCSQVQSKFEITPRSTNMNSPKYSHNVDPDIMQDLIKWRNKK